MFPWATDQPFDIHWSYHSLLPLSTSLFSLITSLPLIAPSFPSCQSTSVSPSATTSVSFRQKHIYFFSNYFPPSLYIYLLPHLITTFASRNICYISPPLVFLLFLFFLLHTLSYFLPAFIPSSLKQQQLTHAGILLLLVQTIYKSVKVSLIFVNSLPRRYFVFFFFNPSTYFIISQRMWINFGVHLVIHSWYKDNVMKRMMNYTRNSTPWAHSEEFFFLLIFFLLYLLLFLLRLLFLYLYFFFYTTSFFCFCSCVCMLIIAYTDTSRIPCPTRYQ